MASFNLANVFFFYFFIFIKIARSDPEPAKLPFVFEKDDHYLKYTFKDGVRFVGIEYDGKRLLDIQPMEALPSAVVFSVKGNTAFVKFIKSLKIFSMDDDGNWEPVFSGKGVGKELDLKTKLSTDDIEYDGTKKIHTYTAKENNLFNVVRTPGGWFSRDKTLWEPNDPRECATKVVYDVRNPNKVLRIDQLNGVTKTFTKTRFGSWKESSVTYAGTELIPEKVEFVLDNQRLEYALKIENNKRYLKYIFEPGVKCLDVKYDGKKVWEILPKKTFPKSVYFCIKGNTAFINYKISRDIYRYESERWNLVYSGKAEGKSLNVLYKRDSKDYYCEKDGKIYTYTPKDNGLFNKVRYHTSSYENVLMEVETALGMATTVQFEEVDPLNMYVLVHCVNGFIRKFVKRDGRPWEEAPTIYSDGTLTTDKVDITMKVKNTTVLTDSPIESYKDVEFLMKLKQPENRVLVQLGAW